MRIAVSGSIATDHLMTFAGRFVDQLLPDQLATLSVSFLVDELEVRRGGVAANVCVGMARLGLAPLLVGAVGEDAEDYLTWLRAEGVDTGGVAVSTAQRTARFTCTTDAEQNQVASFYPGAMSEARDIDVTTLGALDLVLVSPNDPQAMARHTAQCREAGIGFAADPSQQLASLDDDVIRDLLDGAQLLVGNAYEAALLERKTGLSPDQVLAAVGTRITTHGADGVVVERAGEPALRVGVVAPTRVADPTGVGDAFRAGFLAGRSWDLGTERAAQLGCTLATACLESVGPQDYSVDTESLGRRLAAAYGEDAAAEVTAHLPG